MVYRTSLRISATSSSRKLSFRCREFSETQLGALAILGNPICRANPVQSGQGLCTNARTIFRCMGFSETHKPRSYRASPYAADWDPRHDELPTTTIPGNPEEQCIDLPRSRLLRPLLGLDPIGLNVVSLR